FCARCGTKTHMTFERFPAILGVYSGTFDDKDWFERTKENALHFFLCSAPNGTILPAGFKVHDAHYWESEGVVASPQVFDAHTLGTDTRKEQSKRRLKNRAPQASGPYRGSPSAE